MLKFYARFEINEESGDPLTDHDMTQLHYTKITSLQVQNIISMYFERLKNSYF